MTMATEKIYIQIDNDKIELTGQAKEDFIADRQASLEAKAILEAEYKAKQDSRESAIKKLAEIAGLTEKEIEAII
jgi:hypothetical protein